jgi:hypothetical protein
MMEDIRISTIEFLHQRLENARHAKLNLLQKHCEVKIPPNAENELKGLNVLIGEIEYYIKYILD